LLAPIFERDTGFEEPRSNGEQRVKRSAIEVKRLTFGNFASCAHEGINARKVFVAEVNRHAQLAQVAVGTSDFDGLRVHGWQGEWVRTQKKTKG
jgi:hypothetical protein